MADQKEGATEAQRLFIAAGNLSNSVVEMLRTFQILGCFDPAPVAIAGIVAGTRLFVHVAKGLGLTDEGIRTALENVNRAAMDASMDELNRLTKDEKKPTHEPTGSIN